MIRWPWFSTRRRQLITPASWPQWVAPPSFNNPSMNVRDDIVTAPVAKLRYDTENCPKGRSVLLLTHPHGILVKGHYDGNAGYVAWSPLPQRDKEEEARRGLFQPR